MIATPLREMIFALWLRPGAALRPLRLCGGQLPSNSVVRPKPDKCQGGGCNTEFLSFYYLLIASSGSIIDNECSNVHCKVAESAEKSQKQTKDHEDFTVESLIREIRVIRG